MWAVRAHLRGLFKAPIDQLCDFCGALALGCVVPPALALGLGPARGAHLVHRRPRHALRDGLLPTPQMLHHLLRMHMSTNESELRIRFWALEDADLTPRP
eukprot:3980776-Pyramimonas_sp.AAC.2